MKKLYLCLFLVLFLFSYSLAQTVYVTRTGAKYHSSGCRYLSKSCIPIELKDAIAKGYSACSRCDPPTTIKTKETKESKADNKQPTLTNTSSETKSYSSSGRCQATTKKGKQCSRKARPGSNYCWQHGG